MKRLVLLVLVLTLAISPLAYAIEDDSTRHNVTGDISTITVDDVEPATQQERGSASMATDVYLFVDAETASYVTFRVKDDDGKLIKGATIYFSYKGEYDLFGVTDYKGTSSIYMFRNTDYGYLIKCPGYESVEGWFKNPESLTYVTVVMPKIRKVALEVYYKGEPWTDSPIYFNNELFYTDENGVANVECVRDAYQVQIVLEDGTRITRKLKVQDDGTFVLNFDDDSLLVPNGVNSDRFLVYDKEYAPRDYTLSEFIYTAEDVTRQSGETDAEYEARVERYLTEHTSTLYVEAKNADEDELSEEEKNNITYRHRVMIPSGRLQRAWEEKGLEQAVFSNGLAGLRFDFADTHSGDIMKAFAVLYALSYKQSGIETIITEEAAENEDILAQSGLEEACKQKQISLSDVDVSCIRDYVFQSDAAQYDEYLLPDALYDGTTFEYRITPINVDMLVDMIKDGAWDDSIVNKDEILLASAWYLQEELHTWQLNGMLTDKELEAMVNILMDGRLDDADIANIHRMMRFGTLDEETLRTILRSVIDDSMYCVSCWMQYGDVEIEITDLLPSLVLFWNVDAIYEEEYAAQLSLLIEEERKAGRSTEDVEQRCYEELERRTDNVMSLKYEALFVDEGGYNAWLSINSDLEADDEFYDDLTQKTIRCVDVTVTQAEEGSSTYVYEQMEAVADVQEAQIARHKRLVCRNARKGVSVLVLR